MWPRSRTTAAAHLQGVSPPVRHLVHPADDGEQTRHANTDASNEFEPAGSDGALTLVTTANAERYRDGQYACRRATCAGR